MTEEFNAVILILNSNKKKIVSSVSIMAFNK